jgi:NAD(P)-dependent dehydrogenase (short-subunit alcohol dehydrogenase family)
LRTRPVLWTVLTVTGTVNIVGFDQFRYDRKRVLVVGGATGMGAAAARTAAEAGAEVIVMDVSDVAYPVSQFVKVDLRDRASVEQAADQVDGPIAAVLSCAGVADGTAGLMLINFVAHRHLLERLIGDGKLGHGSAVAFISSVAGLGWQTHLERALDFLATPDWDAAVKWIEEHSDCDHYAFSKQAINAYVAHEAYRFLQQGIRLNAIMPGPTDTPLAQANAELWLTFGQEYRDSLGLGPMTAEQMGNTLVFLCSDAASGIAGTTLLVDVAQVSSALTESYPDPIVGFLQTM